MTWQQFKAAVEAKGVKDSDEVAYIDISGMDLAYMTVKRSKAPFTTENRWEIWA